MRMTPVKTKGAWRRLRVMLRRWEMGLRMRELHGDPDAWLLEAKTPVDGSPWSQTRAHPAAGTLIDPGSAVEVVESELRLRLYAVHDYFVGLRTATTTRSVYSLHVLSRSTIEACAFASWVFDPAARPAERLLRGLQLTQDPLRRRLASLQAESCDAPGPGDEALVSELTTAMNGVRAFQESAERLVRDLHAELEADQGNTASVPQEIPSPTRRVTEMLCDEMGMPREIDAYNRMSGIAHSKALSIIGTWNWDAKRPSIDYFSFLEFLHLALCSTDFMLARREACWGETRNGKKLHRIIDRVERILEGEPGVQPSEPSHHCS